MFKNAISFDRVVDEKRGTWNDVKLFGKKIAEQGWGAAVPFVETPLMNINAPLVPYKSWKIGRFYFRLSNPVSLIDAHFGEILKEVRYAVKSYFSVKSGFVQMESKDWDGDSWIWEETEPGNDDPYYVCARFGNGRHIPVPILANWQPGENRLQKAAVRLAGGAPKATKQAELFDYDEE